MHYWSRTIRNGPRLVKMLDCWQRRHPGQLLGLIHGHNHADRVSQDRSWPIVSIGCAKMEDCKEKKPQTFVTQDRKPGTVTQELWDVIRIPYDSGRVEFYRFGAGEDQVVGQ